MYFKVTSSNRLAVRKLLTAAGKDSSEVRKLTLQQLGVALHAAVTAGSITETDANAACASTDAIEHAIDGTPSEPARVTVPHPGNAAAKAIGDLIEALQAGKSPILDTDAIKGLIESQVAAVLKEQRNKPAIIDIRTDGLVTCTLNGEQMHAAFEEVMRVVNSRVDGKRQHAWLGGPSGSGKTHLGRQVAKASGLAFYMTGAIQSKYDLIGFKSPTGDESTLKTPLRMAWECGGVFAWDEIDASDSKALCAFNALLDGGDTFAFPDGMIKRHPDFVCIASANTWGNGATADYVGRTKIDGATLTRFVRISVDYDEALERDMVGADHADWAKFVQSVRGAAKREGLRILITPRHTLQGAALLKAGMDRAKVEAATVFAGLDSDTVTRLRRAA